MTKIRAEGTHNGKKAVIECVEEGEEIKIFKDGSEDVATQLMFIKHIAEQWLKNRDASCVWLPEENTAEAYWAALHEIYFDEPPKIEVEGKLDTFGSPYSDDDTNAAIF